MGISLVKKRVLRPCLASGLKTHLRGRGCLKLSVGMRLASAPDPRGHGRCKNRPDSLFVHKLTPLSQVDYCKYAPSAIHPQPWHSMFRYPANGQGFR